MRAGAGAVGIHASQKEVPQQGMSTASRKSEEHSGHFRSSGISIADRLRPMCVPALVGKQLCSVTIALNLFLPIGRQWSRLRKQNSRAASLLGCSI
jgi:hypothetical protein